MRGIAFDPGGTTGYAVFSNSPHDIAAGDFNYFDLVDRLITEVEPNIIVVEAFRLYPWKAKHKTWSSFPEVEVIGAIKHTCYLKGIALIEQGPDHKQLFDDNKLRRLGFWTGLSKHARDACRHALYYMTVGGDHYWVSRL